MKDGNIRLRPMRIFDGPLMRKGFRNKDISTAGGLTRPISESWFKIWWWMRKVYVFLYCIEFNSEPIGLIGLYNLKVDNTVEMSLVIFNEKMRRLGHGTKAFNLFVKNLKCRPLRIRVHIKADNRESMAFWRKLGFEEKLCPDDTGEMSMELKRDD